MQRQKFKKLLAKVLIAVFFFNLICLFNLFLPVSAVGGDLDVHANPSEAHLGDNVEINWHNYYVSFTTPYGSGYFGGYFYEVYISINGSTWELLANTTITRCNYEVNTSGSARFRVEEYASWATYDGPTGIITDYGKGSCTQENSNVVNIIVEDSNEENLIEEDLFDPPLAIELDLFFFINIISSFFILGVIALLLFLEKDSEINIRNLRKKYGIGLFNLTLAITVSSLQVIQIDYIAKKGVNDISDDPIIFLFPYFLLIIAILILILISVSLVISLQDYKSYLRLDYRCHKHK